MAEIETTRAVIGEGEHYDGTVMPTVQAELNRTVDVKTDARIDGSLYGASVTIAEESVVDGSVMASEAVELEGGRIEGEVGTPGRIVGEKATVIGSVTGTRITLDGCLVRGNVIGTEVRLTNCVVLGLVTATRRLTLEDSHCYTFRSTGETALDGATIVLPQAVADGEVRLETPVIVAGFGRVELDDDRIYPEMTEADLLEHQDTTYLSLAPRLLNLERVADRLDALQAEIVAAAVADGSDDDGVLESVLDDLNVDDPTSVARGS